MFYYSASQFYQKSLIYVDVRNIMQAHDFAYLGEPAMDGCHKFNDTLDRTHSSGNVCRVVLV